MPMHVQSHTVIRLAVHLPNFQSVFFVEGREEEPLQPAAARQTRLTPWFQLNREDPEARTVMYGDIPSKYVFRENRWRPRVRGGGITIGRMAMVSPKDVERYHLRLLLLYCPGAKSFDDLKTVDG